MSQQPPQPPPYYYPPPPKPGMSVGGKIALVVIVGFCIVTGGCFACAAWIWNNAQQDPKLKQALANYNSASKPTPSPVRTPKLSDADKLAQAHYIIEHYTAELDLVRAKDFLSEIPDTAPEYMEAKRLLGQLEPRIRKAAIAEAPAIREQLAEDYRQTIATANSHLNFIQKKITKVKGGYAIWAVHTYFSEYSFKIGSDAHVTSNWIISNLERLHNANIVQVGLKSDNGYSGSCWLKVI